MEKELREKYEKRDDFFEIRYKERLEKIAPILNAFESYVKIEIENTLPKSPLVQPLDYT
ncbi:hypothetical protein LZ906_007355 [Paraclostridium ghonii]|uniref:hypothetical protein n=1 Tax=Paraclostridium ghonii TaxID=29358 RepID=UPI00202CE9BF|nr:hypothetical protein [Paeniclostridium ghonii]MCM0167873.1 hypothetical protein [Paeniclostridium ghonii]